MAVTTNYSWAKPTPDGSSGTWDTILNTAIDDIDVDVKAAETKADVALAENLSFPLLSAGIWAAVSRDTTLDTFLRDPAGITYTSGSTGQTHDLYIPITGLKPGMRITGFKSRGVAPTGTTLVVSLSYYNTSSVATVVSAGHSHSVADTTLTLSGLTHDVVADRGYFFKAVIARVSGSNAPTVHWVQPVVSRP